MKRFLLFILIISLCVSLCGCSYLEQLAHPNAIKVGDEWISHSDPDFVAKAFDAVYGDYRYCTFCHQTYKITDRHPH